jgi:hypothetical protein
MRAFYKYKNWKKTNIRGAVWSVELKASTLQGGVKKIIPSDIFSYSLQ